MILKRISNIMNEAITATETCFYNSSLYTEFVEEREEILRHKWLESEKKGYDIGYTTALFEWILRHRSSWRRHRNDEK